MRMSGPISEATGYSKGIVRKAKAFGAQFFDECHRAAGVVQTDPVPDIIQVGECRLGEDDLHAR